MPRNCLLYYITERTAFAADEPTRRKCLLDKVSEAARAGVDYIQLREKDLSTRELESLARESVAVIKKLRTENRELKTALLINSRIDIALASGADGVHLRSDDISPEEVRRIWRCGARAHASDPLIGISCHSPKEVTRAAQADASFAVFAPVFEKKDSPGTTPAGLKQLEEACRISIPVLALGGITLENAHACLQAGAAGMAAIRLFQVNDIAAIVRQLRG
jgi:thiamine-phosphate pyrophosphorylase